MESLPALTDASPQAWIDDLIACEYAGRSPTAELTGDGRYVLVYRLLFHFTLIIGCVGDDFGYDERWCYANATLARAAVHEWRSRAFKDEPMFWRRHPATGRRRNDQGDPSSERVAL